MLLGLALAAQPVSAGPLRELLQKRAEERREASNPGAEPDDVEAFEGKLVTGPSSKLVLPAGSRELRDLSYGPDPANKIDVYIPPGASNAPIVMMVHGGAWMIGDKGHAKVVANKVARWVPKGYIIASPNYRMSGSPNPANQADDVGRALAFVQESAKSWGGNPEKVLLMGHSAGAHLVALLTSDPSIATRQGARPWLGTVMLDSASMNVVETMESKHPFFYNRVFGKDPAFWAEVSPYHRMKSKPVPVMLVCSTRRDDACPAAREYAAKVTSLGGRATVLPVPLKHDDVNADLGRGGSFTSAVENFMHSVGLP